MRRISSQLFLSRIAERDRISSKSSMAIVMSQKRPLKDHPSRFLSVEERAISVPLSGYREFWKNPATRVISHGSMATRDAQYRVSGKIRNRESSRSRIAAPREINAIRCALASDGRLRLAR